jgi:hypothetical protein
MDAKTEAELRQRINDYIRLRSMTWHEGIREAITKVIADAQQRLRQLEKSAQVERRIGQEAAQEAPRAGTDVLSSG